MSKKLGFLNKEQQNKLSKLLDKVIKAKGILEVLDGFALDILLAFVDDQLLEKVNLNENLEKLLDEFIDSALDGDVDSAKEIAVVIVDDLFNIPFIDDETEKNVFSSLINLIVNSVIKYLDNKEN